MYEVDPLKCPKCGAEMKIVGFVERENTDLIRMWLSAAGLWKEPAERRPPKLPQSADVPTGIRYDTEFLNTLVG